MASRNYRIMVRVGRGIPTGYMRHLLHPTIPRKGIQNLVVYFCTMLVAIQKCGLRVMNVHWQGVLLYPVYLSTVLQPLIVVPPTTFTVVYKYLVLVLIF